MRVKLGEILLAAGFTGLMVTLYLAFNWAPSVNIEAFESPEAQRIFYWHVPAAWADAGLRRHDATFVGNRL